MYCLLEHIRVAKAVSSTGTLIKMYKKRTPTELHLLQVDQQTIHLVVKRLYIVSDHIFR